MTGPSESHLIKMLNRSIRGDATTRATEPTTISIIRFSALQSPVRGVSPRLITGSESIRDSVSGTAEDAELLGVQLAERLLEQGAGEILAALESAHG